GLGQGRGEVTHFVPGAAAFPLAAAAETSARREAKGRVRGEPGADECPACYEPRLRIPASAREGARHARLIARVAVGDRQEDDADSDHETEHVERIRRAPH